MKVWIDQDLCTGDGLCAVAPDVLHGRLARHSSSDLGQGALAFVGSLGTAFTDRHTPPSGSSTTKRLTEPCPTKRG